MSTAPLAPGEGLEKPHCLEVRIIFGYRRNLFSYPGVTEHSCVEHILAGTCTVWPSPPEEVGRWERARRLRGGTGECLLSTYSALFRALPVYCCLLRFPRQPRIKTGVPNFQMQPLRLAQRVSGIVQIATCLGQEMAAGVLSC